MFSATLSVGASVSSWVIVTMPRSSAAFGEASSRSTPSTSMRPASGASAPEAIRASVDFPEPFSPVSACTAPRVERQVHVLQGDDAREALGDPGEAQQRGRAVGSRCVEVDGKRYAGLGRGDGDQYGEVVRAVTGVAQLGERLARELGRVQGDTELTGVAVEHLHVLDHQLHGEVGIDPPRQDRSRQPVAQDPARAAATRDRLAYLVEVRAGLRGEGQTLGDPERVHRAHQIVRELCDLAVPDRPDVHRPPERLQNRQTARIGRIRASGHDRQGTGARSGRTAADRRVEDVDAARREPSCELLRGRGLHRADEQQRGAVVQACCEAVLARERRLDLRRVGKHHEHDVAAIREVTRRAGRGHADLGERGHALGIKVVRGDVEALGRQPCGDQEPQRTDAQYPAAPGDGHRSPTPSSRRADSAPRSPLWTTNPP